MSLKGLIIDSSVLYFISVTFQFGFLRLFFLRKYHNLLMLLSSINDFTHIWTLNFISGFHNLVIPYFLMRLHMYLNFCFSPPKNYVVPYYLMSWYIMPYYLKSFACYALLSHELCSFVHYYLKRSHVYSSLILSQDVLSKQHEMKRVKTQIERLEAQLQTETKIRTDLENRNTALEQDISKVGGFYEAVTCKLRRDKIKVF